MGNGSQLWACETHSQCNTWEYTRMEIPRLFMVALWNRETIYIFILFLLLSSSSFSSPTLSGRKLDVYHTLAHDVALVRI